MYPPVLSIPISSPGDLCSLEVKQLPSNLSQIREDCYQNSLVVVLRENIILYANELKDYADKIRNGHSISNRKLVTGPAGSGKSFFLYIMSQYAKAYNYIVLYIPTSSDFINKNDTMIAALILQNFINFNSPDLIAQIVRYDKDESLATIFNQDLPLTLKLEILIYSLILGKTNIPVFISVDQWNVVANMNDNLFIRFFGKFSDFNLTKGFAMVAVSSSFNPPIGLGQDADLFLKIINVPLYTENELINICDYKRQLNYLPSEDKLSNEKVLELSGRLPRMISFIQESWRAPQFLKNSWSLDNERYTLTRAISYFSERMIKIIEKIIEATDHMKNEELNFALSIFLNKYEFPNPFQYQRWFYSGLFIFENNQVKPICPAIIPALYDGVFNKINAIVEILANNEGYRGNAFESFILAKFRQGPGVTLTLKYKTLDRQVKDQNIQLTVTRIIDQKREDCLTIQRYEENSLIKCYANHPAVDAVYYGNGRIYFIQISIQEYARHRNGQSAADLLRSKILNPDQVNWTVQEYYFNCSPYSVHHNLTYTNWTDNLRDKAIFIHITPKITVANRRTLDKSGAKYVVNFNDSSELIQQFGQTIKVFFTK